MCEYQAGTFECRGDGYVWDADDDGYDLNDKSWPCPCCNTEQYLEDAKEEAESTSYYRSLNHEGCGADIWRGAVARVAQWNPEEVHAALLKIGRVEALLPGDDGEYIPSTKVFEYA